MPTTATPRSPDPRPARTQAAIVAAVEELSARGDEVTVPAIVAEAGVSRSTFYAQFRDLDALAVRILTEVFTQIEELDLSLRASATPIETARATTSQLVAEFAKRRTLYAGVLGSRTTTEAARAVRAAFAEQALGTMQLTVPAGLDPKVAAEYVAGGSLAVITAWLLSDTPEPTERVQQQLLALLPAWLINDDKDTPS
ncbi:TetR/AcrR family transcriptional regulator [Pseudoclavibacter terrae]|uniref:TetR/AcrR family transcriptional regulator n=1 Tax=Pseudoclavibacter terrae TaxID=1530195 RepID=A0A7J5AZ21_9MICO|nr:TetR/AcrR family transcriptional regulator [Pseudoclavibacter terrae]KAB1636811.1 TetR/AcrR family transcriptional regulator [Pseudoclavibacter terrae]